MKKRFCLLFATFSFFAYCLAQENKETLQQTESWNALLQKASLENKPIFIDCYFTGCHPCAQMDKEVFPNELVSKELSENFIGVKIDVFKQKLGDTINVKYGIHGYPTFLMLTPSGQLINTAVGYHDAGQLLAELNAAKQKWGKKEILSGYSAGTTETYPDFYKKYFDREDRKMDPVAANHWIREQKNKMEETTALPLLMTRKLDTDLQDYFLNNFAAYKVKFGEVIVAEKANEVLATKMNKELAKTPGETAFRNFLSGESKYFPAEDWRIQKFMLGYSYYGTIAKDTTALLKFVNEDPLVYNNYMGSLFNSMLVKKQLNKETLSLLCSWADKAVNSESAFDMIRTAANMHKMNGDTAGYKRFVNMAIAKANKYKVPDDIFEKMLAGN